MKPLTYLGLAFAISATAACQEQKKESSNSNETETAKPVGECVDPELVIFDNWNTAAVDNGGTAPDFDTLTYTPPNDPGGTSIRSRRYCLIRIETYHSNNKKGARPVGKLGLIDDNGQQVPPGPWQATGTASGTVQNANWIANIPPPAPGGVVLIHGHYTVSDSSPATWSSNAQSGGRNFARVIVKVYNEGP